MNKLLTFPGQQPLYLGDIDFMQASVLEALKNLVVAITGSSAGNAVLSGIEVSYGSDTVSWTAGIVSVAGEILPVAAGSVSGNMSSTLYVKVVSTLSGGRTFKDGQSHDCWETRAATLTTEATDYRLEDFKALSSGETLYSFDGFRNIYMTTMRGSPAAEVSGCSCSPRAPCPRARRFSSTGMCQMSRTKSWRLSGPPTPSRHRFSRSFLWAVGQEP